MFGLKETELGKNYVVGAGAVVSGKFPDNVIIAGNPAKIIKENE
jgi:acetyltransferase-like isoleucine patch superfamily enzyme